MLASLKRRGAADAAPKKATAVVRRANFMVAAGGTKLVG